jgi:phosphatidylserine/phosphatidylglycerophosphate/cardiolipin synthase-like enzyme
MRGMQTLAALMMTATIGLSGCVLSHETVLPPPDERTMQAPAAVEDDIAVYFSPGGGGMAALINEINSARRSIDVMAYLISTREIADPLAAAVKRGVEVRVIMDAGNIGGIYSDMAIFKDSPVQIWRDKEHKEFHHKVMLIDGRTLITGSFNFTTQAEDHNGENLLIIRNHPRLYGAYLAEFEKHLKHAMPPETKAVAKQ